MRAIPQELAEAMLKASKATSAKFREGLLAMQGRQDCPRCHGKDASCVRCHGLGSIIAIDPRDPDPIREGIFQYHNCYRCKHGKEPCVRGNPRQCEYPRARND